MAYETKPAVFKWASSGATIAMDSTKQALGWIKEMVPFQKLNWLFNQITKHLKHLNERGIGDWDGATNYEVGALVMHTDNEVYRCIVTPTPGAFPAPSDATKWTKLSAYIAPDATTTVKGIAQVATTAEAQNLTSPIDTDMISPLKLVQALQGANQSFGTTSGYQKFPGGLIVQWGYYTESASSLSFPTAFTTTNIFVIATHKAAVGTAAVACNTAVTSSTQFTLNIGAAGATAQDAFVIAIGN